MARYNSKAARERSERFADSWRENSPDEKWAEMTLDEFKAEGRLITEKEAEISASKAHTKALVVELDDLISTHMETCDYVGSDVEGNRRFGPDSALYGGFGYIRKSQRKRGGRRPATPAG